MRVVDFETWAAEQGASRQGFGEPGLHKAGHMSATAQRRAVKKMVDDDRELALWRETLRYQFEEMVAKGLIREPSRKEKLLELSKGHPDRKDVQAAISLCNKYGWI